MKTSVDTRLSAHELRQENARRAAAASAVLRHFGSGGESLIEDAELERWESIRARFVGRLRLPWGLDSARVLRAAAIHRAYWRPAEVRLLVLSESHVWTRESELEASVPLEVFGHPAAPTEFVRLVYCLGYGEKDLVVGRVQGSFGSPQFWKLLAACFDDETECQVVERTEPSLHTRIAAKLRVLEGLRARGVWLAPASPVALYAASQPKPSMEDVGQALDLAWEAYTREAVRDAAPRAVMIVGKMVHDAIGDRVRALLGPSVPVEWMYQPQARRPAAERAAGVERLRKMVQVG
jgi:hypothetical protein